MAHRVVRHAGTTSARYQERTVKNQFKVGDRVRVKFASMYCRAGECGTIAVTGNGLPLVDFGPGFKGHDGRGFPHPGTKLFVIAGDLELVERKPWQVAMDADVFHFTTTSGVLYRMRRIDGEWFVGLACEKRHTRRWEDCDIRHNFEKGTWTLAEAPPPDPIEEAVGKLQAAREAYEAAQTAAMQLDRKSREAWKETRNAAKAFADAQTELLTVAGGPLVEELPF